MNIRSKVKVRVRLGDRVAGVSYAPLSSSSSSFLVFFYFAPIAWETNANYTLLQRLSHCPPRVSESDVGLHAYNTGVGKWVVIHVPNYCCCSDHHLVIRQPLTCCHLLTTKTINILLKQNYETQCAKRLCPSRDWLLGLCDTVGDIPYVEPHSTLVYLQQTIYTREKYKRICRIYTVEHNQNQSPGKFGVTLSLSSVWFGSPVVEGFSQGHWRWRHTLSILLC